MEDVEFSLGEAARCSCRTGRGVLFVKPEASRALSVLLQTHEGRQSPPKRGKSVQARAALRLLFPCQGGQYECHLHC